jgi:hypothetical protein
MVRCLCGSFVGSFPPLFACFGASLLTSCCDQADLPLLMHFLATRQIRELYRLCMSQRIALTADSKSDESTRNYLYNYSWRRCRLGDARKRCIWQTSLGSFQALWRPVRWTSATHTWS